MTPAQTTIVSVNSLGATAPSEPIQNEPTTKSGIPIRNVWYMLLYAWSAYRKKDRLSVKVDQAPSLDALLASVLADQIEQRIRIGLQRDYILTESLVAGIRGRINFGESLKRFSFHRGQAYCHHDVFCADVLNNQIIRSTLDRVAQIGDFGAKRQIGDNLRARIRRLVRNLEGIDLIELTAEQIRRQRLKRTDADYGLMLAICHLLYHRLMPTEDVGVERLPGLDRDDLTLFEIFEQFVAQFFTFHLSRDWDVGAQQRINWTSERECSHLPAMRLDVRLEHRQTGELVYLDTKFTAGIVVASQFGKQCFDSSHLFQIYAYLRSQEDYSPAHRSTTGILLYPASNLRLSESVNIQGHDIRWETLDLAQRWEGIEHDLLAIPAATLARLPRLSPAS